MQTDEDHLIQSQEVIAIIEDLNSWLVSARFSIVLSRKLAKCTESKEDQQNYLNALFEALGISSQVNKSI